MTMLAVMRHAKSDRGRPGLADFDRPLNERGCNAAKRVGQEVRHRHVRFDHVIASPALRVRETLDELRRGYEAELDVIFEPRIYDATVATLLDLVRAIPETVHSPLLVGHNPGLHQLVLVLTANDREGLRRKVEDELPTAAVVLIEFPAVRWDEAVAGAGNVRELILPNELKD